jgi:hypothetical protein
MEAGSGSGMVVKYIITGKQPDRHREAVKEPLSSGLVADGKFTHRSNDRRSASKSGQEKALQGVPIVCLHDKKEDVFRIRPISPDQFHTFGFRIKE